MSISINSYDLEKMTDDELEQEINRLDLLQHAYKILLNSLYGAFGSTFFKFNDVEIAECITLTGQMLTAQTFKVLDREMNKFNESLPEVVTLDHIVFSDTDSAGVSLENYVNATGKSLDTYQGYQNILNYVDGVLNNILKQEFVKVAENTNAYKQMIDFKREKIGKIIPVAKKNYICLLSNDEEIDLYDDKQLTITGLDGAKSTISKFFKVALIDCYGLLLREDIDGLYARINGIEQEFKSLFSDKSLIDKEFFNDIAKRSSVNNIEKYSQGDHKTIPYNVKASIFHNDILKGDNNYLPIKSGDKILLLPLKKGNKYNQNYIAFFDDEFPVEHFDISTINTDEIIDTQFREPVKRLLDVMNREYNLKDDMMKTAELF